MTTIAPWHTLTAAEACARLDCNAEHGLDEAEARRRQAHHGPNRLPVKPRRPAWRRFADQFKSLLTLVLLAAGVLAGLIGDLTDAAAILAVTLFNATLGYLQENRAERILDALAAMLAPQARVKRGGVKVEVGAADLVPGDLVLIEAGDRVPADGRLLQSHGLEIDESTLTGESAAAAKAATAVVEPGAALGDRDNLAYMNTVVTRGRGEMVVTATGAATEIGRIADLIRSAPEGLTPLQRRLDQLGRRLAMLAGGVVLVVLAMGLARGDSAVEVVMTAVALAVAAIPEGLPAVVTVTLAIGMARMARRGAVVRRLAAVETLGSTTVVCSDKTGTLTLNRMTAAAGWAAGRRFTVSGQGWSGEGALSAADGQGPLSDLRPALVPGLLCNDARLADGDEGRIAIGDPTEAALLVLVEKAGGGIAPPRLAELPFDSARKYMVTVHQGADGLLVAVKGAPDVVIELCSAVLTPAGPAALDAAQRTAVLAEVARLGGEAFRVLALATRATADTTTTDPRARARALTLTALVGIADPPRPSAAPAIAACHRAGVAVKMITGDHKLTAQAVARTLGLEGAVITGAELDGLDDEQLAAGIDDIAVFARVSPEHKVRIVQALQDVGHVAAMTGDGVNDAAALKMADIGVAMGRTGSDVTREAAAMVLTDDDFATVVGAMHEGRTITDNILKFVRFQLSTNIGALLAVVAAPLAGLPVPFHPIQILWVNIIMDGPPAMALAFDPARPGLMDEPPQPRDAAILSSGRLLRLGLYGVTMAGGTLAVFAVTLADHGLEVARTLAFTTFVLFQFCNVFNARVGSESAFNRRTLSNGKLWLALLGVLGLQAVAVEWGPAQALFHTVSLTGEQWLLAAAVASSVVVFDEGRKLAMRLWRYTRLDHSSIGGGSSSR
ncbi:MAG: HAD-IC family P-type ATPase [Magnetospirillum sp.]|nr:HAD-IC family P-type ATPase [Magnetospirillum sp.]